ncbi:MAG: class I fructose-bisphosphate aldolase [Hyalangium sp.]|uniref:class I fructose-bisphosphate aldolase n=1 Tax=Hyalangium sp. TaxID=2028555 RepID=UPI00389A37E2
MNSVAKKIRWSRFLNRQSGRGLIVPIDHGLTMGPIPGLDSLSRIESWILHPGITGVIAHKGMVERLGARGLLRGQGIMLHVNGMTTLAPAPDSKELLTSVERAVRLGVDAISLQINFDGKNDAHNLRLLGAVADEADRFGLPVLTMLYDKVKSSQPEQSLRRLRHLVRASVELGTDALKLGAPEELSLIPALLDGVQEHTAVFFAGGEKCEDEELLELARSVALYGASGLCVGRNVFQRENAAAILNRLQQAVLEDSGLPPSRSPFTDPGQQPGRLALRVAND